MKILHKGFTLTEIIVVVAIIGMISVAVGTFSRDMLYLGSVARGSLTVSQDARNILRQMTKEIRAAAPSSNGAYPLIAVSSSSIAFYSDTDGNGVRDQIRYFASSTNLMKGVITPTGSPLTYSPSNEVVTTVISNVKNGTTSIFTYYDGNYAGTSSPLTFPVSIQSVRLVRIDLTLDADINRAPVSKTFTTQVSIRNLKDNL